MAGIWKWMAAALVALPAMGETQRELELERRIESLERRLAVLEARAGAAPPATPPAAESRSGAGEPALPGGLTVSAYFDGNYTWNFERPYNRTNLLRAYDVLHDNFNINQTGLVIERSVDASRRFGLRLDLMYGQATETLQGGAQNEPRPQVYRPVFQAYGSYLAPLGRGLQVDFGKFAGSLGYEGNYTKDQFTYSRAYFFNFLPYYHMGLRSSYSFHDRVSLTHWLVNGAQQTEDFNGFKSNALLLNLKPANGVSWNVNYYVGRESRPNPAGGRAPDGRYHVIDSYASWRAGERLTLVGEADYVVNRTKSGGPPSRVAGGAAYAAYRFHRSWTAAARFEYLDDRHGLFSGASQALKENTVALTYQAGAGFQIKGEWRRDYSNRRFFFTDDPNRLSARQTTATVGLLWWLGKEGSW